jgi:outer membrane biosynthesis protein TonB
LAGIQTPPPEKAEVPPQKEVFSTTSVRSPPVAAVTAPVSPAAPLPTTTTSTSSSVGRGIGTPLST